MNQVKIGKFISECRKAKGLTQQELANRLGLTAKAVSKWETGKGLPDVSLFEDICKELGITLNEFFAGEHIDESRVRIQADENLEEILKEYYKMKKQKNIITIILVVVFGVLGFQLIQFLKSIALVGSIVGFSLFVAEADVKNDISQYEKNYYITTYGGDLDSNLSVFPDEISEDMDVINFESSLTTGLFDIDGYIILEYTLKQEDFAQEIDRLDSLEMHIENYDGQIYTNHIKYVEGEYAYPAYVTIDGFADTYEYALIDEENCRMICVYLAYIDSADFPYTEYLKENKSCYKDSDNLDEYSMYNHSFDDGESYTEFGDSTK